MQIKKVLCSSLLLLFLLSRFCFAQVDQNKDSAIEHKNMPVLEVSVGAQKHLLRDYRATPVRINDLVNTKLEVRFDFLKCYLYGKEWVTLHPHFYPADSLTLDAKGMDIHEVSLVKENKKVPLRYQYDGKELHIQLDKTYTYDEKYTLFIAYTSKPNELKNTGGSSAIISSKGLFFINADSSNPYQPTEVWTQGETEHNSVWFPTIDKPNQKTMQQISMTVPDEFTTLSNGKLVSQKKNNDGTRTDTWKMEHPNSPHLFMMAAGPFVVVKDHWKNIPVNYYVEKKYAPYAKDIFGHTPEMIDFYSKILNFPYPWSKYDQVVVRDYVSGAMENTTATVHGEFMYQTRRQLQDDDYRNESVIAHELFHHWFGDLVTCESWSNLTLNESFADFSEMLWAEHKYGKDLADQHSYEAMQQYFNFARSGKDHPLVNFYYKDKEDVFDRVTYQKGGRILNMLRNYVGDSAFFHSLHYYLEEHKFHPAEAQDLRLAFEHITGKDLNWFWNEWYYGEGYPKLDISYDYNNDLHLVNVIVKQTQQDRIFQLPFAIDIYAGGKKERHKVMMMDRIDTFTYHYKTKPDLINVDGDKVLLAQKEDHKTLQNYIYQYHQAGLYLDRREAIEACAKMQDSSQAATQLLLDALQDKFYGIRNLAIKSLDLNNDRIKKMAEPLLLERIKNDDHSSVRATALKTLVNKNPENYRQVIIQALKDRSLRVESTALDILSAIDQQAAYQQAEVFKDEAEPPLTEVICAVLAKNGDASDFPYVEKNFEQTGSFDKFGFLQPYLKMLATAITNTQKVKEGLNKVKRFAEDIGPRYGVYVIGMLNNFIRQKQISAGNVSDKKLKNELSKQADYARQLMYKLQETMTE